MPGFEDRPTYLPDEEKKKKDAEAAAASQAPAAPAAPIVPDFATPGRADFAAALSKAENRPIAQMQAAQMGPAAQAQASQAQAAQAGNADISQSRAQQQANLAQLQAQAAGTAPSAASVAAQRQGELNLAQQNALMASRGTGANVGAALANIQRTGETGAMNLAANLQANKIAEQQQAQQTLGSALATSRGQDIGLGTANAQLAQQAALQNAALGTQVGLANVGAQNQVAAQNAQLAQQAAAQNIGVQAAAGQQLNAIGAQTAAGMAGLTEDQARSVTQAQQAGQQLTAQQQQWAAQLAQANAQMAQQKSQFEQQMSFEQNQANNQFLGGILGGIGSIGAKIITGSDKNLKKNIKPDVKNQIDEFMESARGVSYDYKNPEHGEGQHISPLAQELAKSSIGKSMVIDTPAGKMVNYGAGFGAVLAALNQHHEDIKKLKGNK